MSCSPVSWPLHADFVRFVDRSLWPFRRDDGDEDEDGGEGQRSDCVRTYESGVSYAARSS